MATRQWWERPRLWVGSPEGDEVTERRVSWLELFSDLVFVVVIAELAHYLAGHISWGGVVGYVLLFVPAWWAWIGGTFYNERFETYDLSYRLFVFAEIIPVAALAIFAHDGLGATSARYALAYAAARVLITLMWVRGGWYARPFWPVARRYGIGFTLSIVLFVVSAFVPSPWRFLLWGIALTSDLVTPITTLPAQSRLPRVGASKIPERFGLFVIIVLGEAMVGVIQGVAGREDFTFAIGLTGTLGLALVFGLWWVYFDFVARRSVRPGIWWSLAWNYLHLPLVMAIAATSAAIQNVLTPHDGDAFSGAIGLLCGSLAVALLAIGALEGTLRDAPDEPGVSRTSIGLKLLGGCGAVAIGVLGGGVNPLVICALLLLLILVQIVYGTYIWFTQPLPLVSPQ